MDRKSFVPGEYIVKRNQDIMINEMAFYHGKLETLFYQPINTLKTCYKCFQYETDRCDKTCKKLFKIVDSFMRTTFNNNNMGYITNDDFKYAANICEDYRINPCSEFFKDYELFD